MPPSPKPTVNIPAPLCVVVAVADGELLDVALIRYSLVQFTLAGGVAVLLRIISAHYIYIQVRCQMRYMDDSQRCTVVHIGSGAHLEQIAVATRILDSKGRFCAIGSIRVPNSANIHLNAYVLPVDLEEISHRGGGKGKVVDIRWVVIEGDHDEDYWRVPRKAQISRCARWRKCRDGSRMNVPSAVSCSLTSVM
jgi:hypothetical protein